MVVEVEIKCQFVQKTIHIVFCIDSYYLAWNNCDASHKTVCCFVVNRRNDKFRVSRLMESWITMQTTTWQCSCTHKGALTPDIKSFHLKSKNIYSTKTLQLIKSKNNVVFILRGIVDNPQQNSSQVQAQQVYTYFVAVC